MLGAIGSSPGLSGLGKSSAGLDAQLTKYEIQLADWTNCPSCKTAEGKAKIAEISDKISDLKQRQQDAEVAKQSRRPLATDAVTPTSDNQNERISSSVTKVIDGYLGSRLDVFA